MYKKEKERKKENDKKISMFNNDLVRRARSRSTTLRQSHCERAVSSVAVDRVGVSLVGQGRYYKKSNAEGGGVL